MIRILVTGGTGFLGQHLVTALRKLDNYKELSWVGRNRHATLFGRYSPNPGLVSEPGGYDLRHPDQVETLFADTQPTHVFHLAGYNGGIAFNAKYQARIFADNTMLALNVLEASQRYNVKKVLSVVASCAYPEMEWVEEPYEGHYITEREIMKEKHFLDGPPHDSVSCHAYAKRNLLLASQFYRMQYGLNAVCVCPTTLYGPGDSYDPLRTKLMGGMVKRFVDAVENGDRKVACWGTGRPKREFLYVEDCARLLIEVMGRAQWDRSDIPLNLGTGQELTTKKLARLVAERAGYGGKILWDTDKPDGQLRKRLDLKLMKQYLPDFEFTPLEEGVDATIEDYKRIFRPSNHPVVG